MTRTLLSWNVNGLRALHKRGGFVDWLLREQPDALCLQEIKALPEQLDPDLREVAGYHAYFNSGEFKGYSGVALYTREEPLDVAFGLGVPEFDAEGRLVQADYGAFVLFGVYFPNGRMGSERLDFKMRFYDAFLDRIESLRAEGRRIVVCGDVNTAHTAIDLARPGPNSKVSGFLPHERAWIDRWLAAGYVDTFRLFSGEPGHYTWWANWANSRARNIGWRIDYFVVSDDLAPCVERSWILSDVYGSDHCPIGLELNV